MAELAEQLRVAETRLPACRIESGSDGTHLVYWHARLPNSWAPDAVELFITVPPAYPAQAPSGFDVVGTVTRTTGEPPSGSGSRELSGRTCQHYCWNPSGAIEYTDLAGLWLFAKFSESRFLTVP